MSSDSSILFQNNLDFMAPVPSSVTVNRVLKKQQFQNRSYDQQQTMTCVLNTGVDMVDCVNSSLVIKVRCESEGKFSCGFGTGSAMNLIQNIRIFHRSGTQYTNTQRINLYRKFEDRYTQSENWFNTIGELMGYNSGDIITNQIADQDTFIAIIPLSLVHPFFAPEGGKFLPSVMASGLRLEMDLATLSNAFLNGTTFDGAPTSYTIEDVYINTMSVTLMDSAQASLNTTASKQSLEYVYRDIFTSQNSQPSDSTTINIDINRSVGFCEKAFTLIQLSANVNNVEVDAFSTLYYPASWWYTLGSNQYPNQKISEGKSAYSTALITYDKFKAGSLSSANVQYGDFLTADGIYSVNLERDTALSLSASPVNSSRALRFESTLDDTIGFPTVVTVFMIYLSSARSSLLSSKVDI